MKVLPEFRPGSTAKFAHRSLQKSVEMMNRAHHSAVLWFGEIMARQLYRELGYSTMRAYALEELGFSATRAGDFIRLTQKLESLPLVKEKVASGDLGYTQAREIIKVADKSNEHEWVAVAQSHSRRELETVVKQAKQQTVRQQAPLIPGVEEIPIAVVPVKISFELTPTQNARYEAMLAKIGHRGNKADLLLEMVEALLEIEKTAPRGAISAPRYQVHVHKCPTCATCTIATPQGDAALSPAEVTEVECDAQIHTPGRRNTSTIPPKTRREVLARDRHRCRRKGCHHTRHLDIHHLVPRASGGDNRRDNLVTLCTACHHLWHEKKGDLVSLIRPVDTCDEMEI